MDSAARPDEEEARRRRSTDCIYFLASPLTCKKGSECEFRHSDAARMNPRDCWYWFNGNCANPKCSFRHPPLDSLLGAPTTPQAAQQSAPQVPVPAQAHGSAPATGTGTAKQGVPCYYFQKGMCAKGDRCAFLHVPQAAGNPAQQPTAKVFTPALQPKPQLENSWTKPNSPAQLNTPSGIFDKSNSIIHGGKLAPKQNVASRVDQSSRIYQNHNTSYVQSGTAKHYQPQPSVKDDLSESGMEVGEFVREPSAGSGVLVGSIEDDAEHSSFKGNHDSYHGTNGEQHTGMMKQRHGNYEAERSHRSSSESLSSEKRISQREPMPVSTGSLDLRHRLLKQRRLNDPRSIQVPDRHDAYLEDELNDHNCWRGEEQAAHESISRSRLRGRIKLPGETSFDSLGSRSEKESDRGPRARVSPPKHTDLRGKLHERLKARSNEDIPGNAKGWVAKASSGEDAGSLNFAGPKSLAELKAKKVVGSSGENAIKSLGSSARVISVVASRDSSEPVVPFEGPKPLSVILKRKRTTMSENAAHSGSIQEDGEEEGTVGVEEESQNKVQILEGDTVEANMEGNAEEEGAFHPEDGVAYDDDSLTPVDGDNAAEDAGKELEEHQDVEAAEDYDYEAADVNAEEDNDYQEYEDDDDLEDDDDFARKVGVMIS